MEILGCTARHLQRVVKQNACLWRDSGQRRGGRVVREIRLADLPPAIQARITTALAAGNGDGSPRGTARETGTPPHAPCPTPSLHVGRGSLDPRNVPILASDCRRVYEAALVATWPASAVDAYRTRRSIILATLDQLATAHRPKMDVYRQIVRDNHGIRSVETLRRWLRDYRRHGEPGLVPRWKKRTGSKTIPPRLQDDIEKHYASLTKPTVRQCWRFAWDWCMDRNEQRDHRAACGLWFDVRGRCGQPDCQNFNPATKRCRHRWLTPPSYNAVARHIDHCLARRPALIEAARNGDDHWKNHHEPVVTRDERVVPLNYCWVADGRTMDTHVVLPNGAIERPVLIAFADLRSADFVGWTLRTRKEVTSDAVACAIRNGITGFRLYDEIAQVWHDFPSRGVPENVYIDWGKQFNAKNRGGKGWSPKDVALTDEHKQTLFGTLGISPTNAIRYLARSKPIESWFSSFKARIENLIAGWCGHNPQAKPEDLDARRKSGRLLSWSQYVGALARAIQHWRTEQPIGHRERPPAGYWDGFAPDPFDEAELDLLLLRKELKKIRQGSIVIETNKDRPWHFTCDDPAFQLLAGVLVEVRWSPDTPETCIVISRHTGQRWVLHRSDLRHESWNYMNGDEPGEAQRRVNRARTSARVNRSDYKRWAADQTDPALVDPFGTLRAADANGREIRQIARDDVRQAAAARATPSSNRKSQIGNRKSDPPAPDPMCTLLDRLAEPTDA